MKCVFAFLLIVALIFSTYEAPPIDEVKANNLNALVGASIRYAAMQNDSGGLIHFANATILAIDPSIDSRISYSQTASLLWMQTSEYETEYHTEIHSRDGYYCFGKMDTADLNFANLSVQTNAIFTFRNITKTIQNPELHFTIPFNNSELAASEGDTINISLDAQFHFTYNRKREVWEPQSFGEGIVGCGLQLTPDDQIEFIREVNANITYLVEGEKTNYFLVAPILGEQWFKNNRFDLLMFTNREIYAAQAKLNNKTIIGNWKFHSFEIENDSLGMQRIVSLEIATETDGVKENYGDVDIPNGLLKESETFTYAYEINSTYSGIGNNKLEIELLDEFGNSLIYSEMIMSRTLSYDGNKSETGSTNSQNIRKGIDYGEEKTNITYIEFGMIGILLIVLLLNFTKRK